MADISFRTRLEYILITLNQAFGTAFDHNLGESTTFHYVWSYYYQNITFSRQGLFYMEAWIKKANAHLPYSGVVLPFIGLMGGAVLGGIISPSISTFGAIAGFVSLFFVSTKESKREALKQQKEDIENKLSLEIESCRDSIESFRIGLDRKVITLESRIANLNNSIDREHKQFERIFDYLRANMDISPFSAAKDDVFLGGSRAEEYTYFLSGRANRFVRPEFRKKELVHHSHYVNNKISILAAIFPEINKQQNSREYIIKVLIYVPNQERSKGWSVTKLNVPSEYIIKIIQKFESQIKSIIGGNATIDIESGGDIIDYSGDR